MHSKKFKVHKPLKKMQTVDPYSKKRLVENDNK